MPAAPPGTTTAFARPDLRGKAAVAAIAAAGVAACFGVESGAGAALAAGLVLVATAIAVIDARRFLIPDALNAAGIILGLAHAGLVAPVALEGIGEAMLRGGVVALAFLALRAAYRRLRGRDGLGLGDVKLAAVAGVWLGWTMIPIAIDIAAGAALAFVGLRQLATGHGLRRSGRLPFGLFFAPAIWIGWFIERWLATGV